MGKSKKKNNVIIENIDNIQIIGIKKSISHNSVFGIFLDIKVSLLPTTYIIDQNFKVVRGGKGIVTYPMVKTVLDELLTTDWNPVFYFV